MLDFGFSALYDSNIVHKARQSGGGSMSKINTPAGRFLPVSLPEVYAPRRGLLAAFDAAAAGRFIYVGTPAGSGKTVLKKHGQCSCSER
jgi:hypothetical protein